MTYVLSLWKHSVVNSVRLGVNIVEKKLLNPLKW